jgi:hypothetical protein
MRSQFLLRLFQDVNVSKKKLWPELDDATWERLVRADPTYVEGSGQRGKYLPAIVRWVKYYVAEVGFSLQIVTDAAYLEETKDILAYYDRALKKGFVTGKKRDINSFPTKGSFLRFVGDLWNKYGQDLKTPTEIIKEGTDLIWTDGDWKLYRVNTYEASRLLGTGTNWCVSADSDSGRSYFEEYKRDYGGDYYIIMRGKKDIKDKYFFHIESGQVRGWDQKDRTNWFEDDFVEGGPPLKERVPAAAIQALVDINPKYLYLATQEREDGRFPPYAVVEYEIDDRESFAGFEDPYYWLVFRPYPEQGNPENDIGIAEGAGDLSELEFLEEGLSEIEETFDPTDEEMQLLRVRTRRVYADLPILHW